MIKPIIFGIAGGLLGAFADSFIKTYKQVKADMTQVEVVTPVSIKEEFKKEMAPMYVSEVTTVVNEVVDYEEVDDLVFDDEPVMTAENAITYTYSYLVKTYGVDIATEYYHITRLMEEFTYEELEYVRYDINSNEALEQYKAMRLADIQESDWRVVLFRLFNLRFTPSNETDASLRMHAMESRESFFGMDSVWYEEVSFAEVILHFAELMSMDFGESVDYYAEELINNLGFTGGIPLEELARAVHLLENHEFYTQAGFGIFGLTPSQQLGDSRTFFGQYNNSSYFDE